MVIALTGSVVSLSARDPPNHSLTWCSTRREVSRRATIQRAINLNLNLATYQRRSVEYKQTSRSFVTNDSSCQSKDTPFYRIQRLYSSLRLLPCQLFMHVSRLTLPLNASKGFMLSSYLSLYFPVSSSRLLITPFSIDPLVPLGPATGTDVAPSRYDCIYRTFSYSFKLSAWRDLISARRSDIVSNCFRSSSSSSAFRCLNRSR